MSTKKILLLDNYDSFTYNLYHQIEKLTDSKIDVFRNDEIKLEKIIDYDLIVLSPGPKLPKDAGMMMNIIEKYHKVKSFIGICLGMQGIAEFFGSKLTQLKTPEHGQSKSMKIIYQDIIFKNCPETFNVGRYHSWGISKDHISNSLIPLSVDENNYVMSFKHKEYPIIGLQYHPESILTEYGNTAMQNILNSFL